MLTDLRCASGAANVNEEVGYGLVSAELGKEASFADIAGAPISQR
jgi:hypothetical protein